MARHPSASTQEDSPQHSLNSVVVVTAAIKKKVGSKHKKGIKKETRMNVRQKERKTGKKMDKRE